MLYLSSGRLPLIPASRDGPPRGDGWKDGKPHRSRNFTHKIRALYDQDLRLIKKKNELTFKFDRNSMVTSVLKKKIERKFNLVNALVELRSRFLYLRIIC